MKKKIGADFFRKYVNITDMKPNGKGLFTYVKYTTVMDEDKYLSDLYLYDTKARKTIDQLTFDGYVNTNEWLDDENLIILGAHDEEDKAEEEKGIPIVIFNKFNIRTKQYTKLFKLYHNVYKFCIIDENRYLMLASESPVRDQWLKEADGDWDQYLKIQERESKYFIADEVPFWSGSGDLCNKERYRAYLYDHGELTRLHDDSFSTWDIASYKDEYGIFYGLDAGGFQKSQGKLYKIDYATKEVTAIDDSMQYIYTKIQTVDSNHVLVCRNDRSLHGEYQDEYIDVIDLKTGNFTRNNKTSDWHLYDMVMTDISYLSGWLNKIVTTENGFYFISTVRDSSNLYFVKYGDDESLRPVTRQTGKILDYFVDGDTVWMSAMRGISGGEYYTLDLKTGEETRLTNANKHLEEEYEFPEIEDLTFTNSDGIEIQGWAMRPCHFDSTKKYPTILFIHGGPECAYGPVGMHEQFAMCAESMGVIFCNPRGSEGRGADFMDIRTKWGTVDYTDLMEFTEHAVATCDWIDGDRLGVTGGSYGGIMTNWIVGHTNRFKAAVSDRGVSDLFCDFFLGDIGMPCNTDTYGCTPWDDPAYIWEQSALKYAADIKTPILFIHGVDDCRCPFVHSLALHTAITYCGGTSKVIGFRGEAHELCRSGSPVNRERRVLEMIKWFQQYL